MDFNKREAAAVKKALKEGIPAAIAYRDKLNGMPSNAEYTWATKGLYARIGWYNFDHFSPNSRQAYAACHSNAIEIAAEAGKNEQKLKEAYYMEAWALHFLTDAFSSGHLRVPRKELHDDNRARAWTGGPFEVPVWDIQARYMHDEDSACGLLVLNDEGREWIAYGDKEFFGGHNLVNRLHWLVPILIPFSQFLIKTDLYILTVNVLLKLASMKSTPPSNLKLKSRISRHTNL